MKYHLRYAALGLLYALTVSFGVASESLRENQESQISNDKDSTFVSTIENVPAILNQISFWNDVKPIFDNRCVVCHACYDAPCQLKLGSIEGIERGANKAKVYDATRLVPAQPTRLFVDANTLVEWRQKNFFPVLSENNVDLVNTSLLAKMLQLKIDHPLPKQGRLPEQFKFDLNRDLQCPKPDEFNSFKQKYSDWGMPYALPQISNKEHQIINTWLKQGAKITPRSGISPKAVLDIKQWELFLNHSGLKQQLMARYIFEHLFLGHLHFQGRPNTEFFTLVRSRSTPEHPLDEVVTDLPYQNPKVNRVYYRFKPVRETIVDKTHFVYELDGKRMKRFEELFLDPNYKVENLPGYSEKRATNPFETFVSIPLDSRYKFLLDDAAYFIAGFIKGPVCKGQVALNVIQDRFWVMFVNPELNYDESAAQFLSSHSEQLSLPAAEGEDIGVMGWMEYDKLAHTYLEQKDGFIGKFLENRHSGLTENDIWNGGGKNPNAALTIFRHFDSATVVKGFIGDFPKTAWVIDYPILERLHYLLVAGFNVYGTVGHQLATRKYMDYLRIDSENNFLRFLPIAQRMKVHDEWYVGIIPEIYGFFSKPLFNLAQESGIKYRTNSQQKKEFLLRIFSRLGALVSKEERINRCEHTECQPAKIPTNIRAAEITLRNMAIIKGEVLGNLPEISFLRITNNKGNDDLVYTLLVDKDLENLSTLFAENIRRVPKKDRLTIIPGFLGSYPNFFFQVEQRKLSNFISDFAHINDDNSRYRFYSAYGIRRSNPDFWKQSDWFYQQYKRAAGIESGLFDLSRYENF